MPKVISFLIHLSVIGLLGSLIACESPKAPKVDPPKKETLIDYNKIIAKKEAHQIDKYIERRNLNMIATGTGLHYSIYDRGAGSETAKAGQVALLKFKVSLLDGSVVYSSEESGPQEFLIERDNVESGLHEGIKYLHKGDKAKLILPSHLAHGLLGDQKRIPPRHTIVYDIELLELK